MKYVCEICGKASNDPEVIKKCEKSHDESKEIIDNRKEIQEAINKIYQEYVDVNEKIKNEIAPIIKESDDKRGVLYNEYKAKKDKLDRENFDELKKIFDEVNKKSNEIEEKYKSIIDEKRKAFNELYSQYRKQRGYSKKDPYDYKLKFIKHKIECVAEPSCEGTY